MRNEGSTLGGARSRDHAVGPFRVRRHCRGIVLAALAWSCAHAGEFSTKEGAELHAALIKEAAEPGKPAWKPMLLYLAGLHGRSVLPATGYFKYPYESIGPGYQSGKDFGHIDLTHERLDTVRASPEHVRRQIINELAGQQDDGVIPGVVTFGSGKPSWKNFKIFPPIWIAAVDAYVDKTGDLDVLREALVALRKQIGWIEAKRQLPDGGFYYLDIVQNTWESGIDEGVRYDQRPPHPAAAVDACSHVYDLYRHAATWSQRLGQPIADWPAKADRLRDYIRTQLWDERTGWFYDRWVQDGSVPRHLDFEGMWPVVVGAATPEQAKRVIDEHLLNSREFFAPHPITTVAMSDPKFELRMWRGPVWNCMTYWAARGCARYERPDAAHRILEAALDATATEFTRTHTLWEFYDPNIGDQTALKRKPAQNVPCRDYIGHNPLFAMVDLWRRTQ